MLDKKVTHKRLKDKAIKEPKYLKWLHEVLQPECFVCNTSLGIEIHHCKEHSTDERIDSFVIPLCYNHHHGTELSPHGTAKAFLATFSMKEQRVVADKLYQQYKKEK